MDEQLYAPGMIGCSDGGCIFEYKRPGTMITNGGCQCQKELQRSEAGRNALHTITWLRKQQPVSMPTGGVNDTQGYVNTNVYIPNYSSPYGRETRTMKHKVNMIKEVREATGYGLKESKEAVDAVIDVCVTFDEVIECATYYLRNK